MRQRFLIFCIGLMLLVSHVGVLAQARSVFWRRWDVTIDNVDTRNNQFTVTENYDLNFSGTFTYGSAVIPYDNLEDIRNIQVLENGEPLRSSCSQRAGTFCASQTDEGLSITYYFTRPVTDSTRQVKLIYDIVGALRVYEGGDQLWWIAIPSEHYGFSIGSSTITVELPEGFAPREGVDPVVTYGATADVQVNGTRVVATATEQISGNETFEIRVQYPHDPNARVARWQTSFDQQRAFDENVRPLIDVGLLALSLLIAVGGVLFIYTRWQTKGRDPKVGPVPTFLTEPPSELRPAVVGSLVDERVDLRDIMSTLIDLAHRGYVVIEETQSEGLFGLGRSSEFEFKRTDKPTSDLRPYEQRLVESVFRSHMERTLNSMRNTFYSAIPRLQSDLYDEMVSEGLFTSNPNSTRNMWGLMGGLLIFAAFVGGIFSASLMDTLSTTLLCIPFAVGLVGAAALMAGQAMPAKTQKGAEEAAKWKAFEEYLRNMDKYQGVGDAAKHFEAYLPYAVAFGLDRSWIRRFSQVDYIPIPPWYYPTYLGGPYGRGYIPGSPMPRMSGNGGVPGDLARAGEGGFSLDNMSGNLAGGLESISNGLTTMMDSAARVMTSRPQQASGGSSGSWRSGGSSWSGGGFSGGGGSGGGSRGFG